MSRLLALSAVAVAIVACGGKSSTVPPPITASETPELTAMLAQLDEALAKRPGDQVLLLLRAAYAAEAGRTEEAINFVEQLDATGWDVPFSPSDFQPIRTDPRFTKLEAGIAARSPNVTGSELAFSIAGQRDLIPEGIAVDAATGTFFVGSIRKRTILAIDKDRTVRPFVASAYEGLSGVLGLKVDATRGLLWATSFASEGMEGFDAAADTGRSEVTAYTLADGTQKRRIAFPAGEDKHLLNDLAIAADGTLYITDSLAGAVWRVPADKDVFEPLVAAKSFAYPNGIALAPNNKLLVAHGTGMSIIDLDAGTHARFPPTPRVPLGGIDGMVLDGKTLYAVQNGLGVPRLVAITLDDTYGRAVSLKVLENSPTVFAIPTTTALHEGALYTIANAQLDAIGPAGFDAKKALQDPRIVRTKLTP